MGAWCSLVNIFPCHGKDHGFKSRHARKWFLKMSSENTLFYGNDY